MSMDGKTAPRVKLFFSDVSEILTFFGIVSSSDESEVPIVSEFPN